MYNRYMPDDTAYIPISDEPEHGERDGTHHGGQRARYDRERQNQRATHHGPPPGGEKKPGGGSILGSLLSGFSGGEGLGGILKGFEDMDTGDILLLLIVLFLLLENDDHLEIVITLGLLLIMGLGGKDEE